MRSHMDVFLALCAGGASLALGRGFCAWGCFFGGIEEGFSSFRRKPLIRRIASRWTLLPWAVLALVVVGSAISLAPFYCEWLCPFKTVTEFPAVTSLRTAVQFGIFISLFTVIFGLEESGNSRTCSPLGSEYSVIPSTEVIF